MLNKKRAFLFSLFLYLSSFIIYTILFVLPFSFFSPDNSQALRNYVFTWVVNIPIVLLLAKWYFKKATASVQHGFRLGCVAIIFAIVFDALFMLITVLAGQSIDQVALFSDWKPFVTLVEIIALTTIAGGEFDKTYSATM